jgi:DNA polymerase III alpha subunit
VLSPEHEGLPSFEMMRERGLSFAVIELLIRAQAFRCSGAREGASSEGDYRAQQLWQWYRARSHKKSQGFYFQTESKISIESYGEWESLLRDHAQVGLSSTISGSIRHPAHYAREFFFSKDQKWVRAEDVYLKSTHSTVDVVGLLTCKQRPPTAGGLCFLTLEDESGFINLTLDALTYERYRLVFDKVLLLAARGRVEKSHQREASDPTTAAVSVRVDHLYNPFQKQV